MLHKTELDGHVECLSSVEHKTEIEIVESSIYEKKPSND